MIAVDTNLLVYAHRRGYAEHGAARRALDRLVAGGEPWGISLPRVAEFWSHDGGFVTIPGLRVEDPLD